MPPIRGSFSNGSSFFHCASVKSLGYMTPTYATQTLMPITSLIPSLVSGQILREALHKSPIRSHPPCK